MQTLPSLRFASTKIQPPRLRTTQLPRPRVDAALLQALRHHRVLLLQAPAGFGKTSALAALVAPHSAGLATAWVALDEDDDAERLFACLVAALEPHDLPWRTAPEALVDLAGSDEAGLKRAVAELVNALAGSEVAHGAIVLDDLHRVQAPSAFALLDALIKHLPPRWTLVLATRTAPPLALARLRATGELAELTQDQLRFDRSESAAFLHAEAFPDAIEQAEDLFQRTAGWPAGLRLALAALRTRGAGRTQAGGRRLIDRHLFDYLAAEVLDDMPPALHDFLLRCAVLPELTAPRAAAVSGDPRAAEWLDEIERRGLFANTLDAHERTLVLHDLFREALLQRQRELLPGELPTLLKRAAAGEPDVLRRVGFLLRAEDWAAAEAALVEDADALFVQGGAGEVLRLVEQFPPAQRSARLSTLGGAACGLRWQWAEMARWLHQAVQLARDSGDTAVLHDAQARLACALYPLDHNSEAERLIEGLQGQALAPSTRALMLLADSLQHFRRGQHPQLPGLLEDMLQQLEQCPSLRLWWEATPPVNWTTIAGMPPLLERYLAGALPRLGERTLPMRAQLRLLSAVRLLWLARMEDAEDTIRSAEDDIQWLAVSGETQVGVEIFRSLHAAMLGRSEALRERLQGLVSLEDEAPPERRELWRHQIAVYGVRLSHTVGDAEALREWAALLRENPLQSDAAQNARAIAARARYAAAQGRWADAAVHFELLMPHLPRMDVMGQRTDLTLRAGHTLLQLGRTAEAAPVVAPVLDRLRAEGVRGQALLCGPVVLQQLAEARWGALLTPAQQQELAAVAQLSAALCDAPAAAPAAVADEPGTAGDGLLSEREREVLERMAAGDSNKIIARELDISPHTVKRHVANILDKLGLSSRGQASAWLHKQQG
jgi:LuxR family maltose regulon positive regulatory protein